MRTVALASLAWLTVGISAPTSLTSASAQDPQLRLDHFWIATPTGAAEARLALERLGFRIAPTINRHEGQGTASATVEFKNGYIELIWPDDSVKVIGLGGSQAKQRFTDRANWRATGTSPFGIAFSRTPTTPKSFPFPTWVVSSQWMGPGESIVMMTPRGSPAINLALHPKGVDTAANAATIAKGGSEALVFERPNGATEISALKITAPNNGGLPASFAYVNSTGAVVLSQGREWLAELTLDDGRAHQSADLRPTLPLIVHW